MCGNYIYVVIEVAPGEMSPKRIGKTGCKPWNVGRSGNVVSPTVRQQAQARWQGSRKATCGMRGYGMVEKAKGCL